MQVGGAGWLAALWRRVSGLAADAGGHQSCFYFITLVEIMPYSSVCGGSQETSGVVVCSGEVVGGDWCPQSSVCHVRSYLVLFKLHQVITEEGKIWCRSARISKVCPIP